MTWKIIEVKKFSPLLCSWEFSQIFMVCKYPATNEAKRIAIMKMKKNLNNRNNGLLNAAVSAAWNYKAASTKGIHQIY